MALADEVRIAIAEGVGNRKQPDAVSDLLVAWLDQLASGNESLEEPQAVAAKLELIFDALDVTLTDDWE
jgi:hypothetical protein